MCFASGGKNAEIDDNSFEYNSPMKTLNLVHV